MANDKRFVAKNGLRTQNIEHVSPDRSSFITATMLDSDTLSFDGDSGQLFSLTDTLTGTIFSVNDITGIPSIEVDDDGTIRFAEFAGNVLVGTDTDNGEDKLQVNGSISGDGSNITKISVPTSDSPPSNPKDGELWWDSDEGNMFVYYSDGSSEQWVPSNVGYPGPQGPRGYTGSSTTTLDISNDTSTDPLYPVMVTGTGSGRDGRVNTSNLAFDSNNGRLGIGTAFPNSRLDVAGVISCGALNTGQGDNELYAMDQDVRTSDSVTFSSITESSSLQYKTDIVNITDSIQSLSRLEGVTYKRKSNNEIEAGLIAEQVFDILPSVVKCKNGKPDSIAYTKLTAYLIEAVKELKQELDELKNK